MIFNELYGVYFRITEKILGKNSVTAEEIRKITAENGFRDSLLFLPQKLIPQKDGSDWGLLKECENGVFSPITRHKPKIPLTLLQKSWIKAKLSDPKMKLFIDDDAAKRLNERLSEVQPLYRQEHFRYTDRFSDGDNFSDRLYAENFRKILSAVKKHEIADIEFVSGRDKRMRLRTVPLKIQYSPKNDKFRVLCRNIKNGGLSGGGIINIGRIKSISLTGEFFDYSSSVEDFFASRKCAKPVTVRVTPQRNGVERFLMEFSSYEKKTELDLQSGNCTVQLWYDRQDETELLIRLLSFGPVLEIISPPEFRRQAAERVNRQYELLYGNKK